jgi:uncharacterized protein YbbK (DUF523 family)/uncharacterized protein YbgA (DUF1722 family)
MTPFPYKTLRPKVGISSCLAGERVRFNASNVRADWIMDTLAEHVDLLPLCPEMAMGLSVPREAMRFTRGTNKDQPKLVTSFTGRDMTELAEKTADQLIAALPEDLDAYILMGRSPMCGLERIKVYDTNKIPQADGVGVFAARLVASRPDLVVCEAGRLTDPAQRERFVLRMFAHAAVKRVPAKLSALQDFHRRYKFLISGQGAHHLKTLGALVGSATRRTIHEVLETYRSSFFLAFAGEAKRSTMANSLAHIYGFLKNDMDDRQKLFVRNAIDSYKSGATPLLVPLSMLQYANQLADSDYVASQTIFAPYPEMGLRHGI